MQARANNSADPRAWVGADLQPTSGRFILSSNHLAEIDGALAILRANPLPVLSLTPDDVEMPACAALAGQVRQEINQGLGFAIIDRLPLDHMNLDEATAIYWLLSSMIGRSVAQKWVDGRMIYSVTDLGKPPGNGVRPDVTNVEQNFHTDNSYNIYPPDVVGLLCLHPAQQGGISRVVSLREVHERLRERHPDLLARLYEPFCCDRQREHAGDDKKTIWNPVFTEQDGGLRARVSRQLVIQGYQLLGQEIDARGADALAALTEIIDDPALYNEFFIEPGQMQFVNNRVLGHKRTGFIDFPEPERKRHLLRVWLRDKGRRFYNG
jgi:hypothetical protein